MQVHIHTYMFITRAMCFVVYFSAFLEIIIISVGAFFILFLNYVLLWKDHKLTIFRSFSEKFQGNRAIPQRIGLLVIFLTYILAVSSMFVVSEPVRYTDCQNASTVDIQVCRKDYFVVEVGRQPSESVTESL